MKSKPLVLMLLLLIAIPIPLMNFIVADNNDSAESYNSYFKQPLGEQNSQPYTIVQAQNILHDGRWTKPLKTHIILSNLVEYNNRAMISFFTTEDRDQFALEAIKHGIEIDRIFKAIPAIVICYEDSYLNQVNFKDYEIKYTYPIGTYEYTVPMNVDMEFPGLVNLAELREALEVDALHALNHTGWGVTVAILDSGLNTSRVPALNGFLNYPDIDPLDYPKVKLDITPITGVAGLEDSADFSGHGTHIATILAGNGKYYDDKGEIIQTDDYGIAPDAQIISVKVLDQFGYGKDEWLVTGFDEAIDQAPELISASLTSVTFAEMGDPIEELVYEAARRDILVIASAGNYGPSGGSVGAPAIWDHVISVGASDGLDDLAIFTSKGLNQNFSAAVDIIAPGVAIQGSDAEDGGSRWVSGTSVSAPIVSGVLALLVGAFPGINIHKYEAALLGTAEVLPFPVIYQGNGMVNPYAAYTNLTAQYLYNMSAMVPRYMVPDNEYYYECVAGKSTTFHVKLISSYTGSLNTALQLATISNPEDYIQIANQIDVYEGWNHFNFTVTIPADTEMRYIQGFFGFSGPSRWPGSPQAAAFVFQIVTRYLGGTILFDMSHENDTANKWFDASTPYGTHMHLTRILKDRGFRINTHTGGDYNFTDVNILVISDPELNFTAQEITDIYDFVSDGGSLLFLVDSVRFIDAEAIETSPIIFSNYYTCDELLASFDLTVWDTVPINVPYEVFTTDDATMLSVESFMWWGKMLHFTDEDPDNIVVARMPEVNIGGSDYVFDVAVAKEVNNGRIMVFGSGYPFTDHGLLPDSLEISPSRVGLSSSYINVFNLDENNLLLVNETFEWLINTHRPSLSFDSNPEEILIRQEIDMEIQITLNDDTIYTTGGSILNATLLRPGHYIESVELVFNPTTNKYELTYTFTEYGEHFLFVPLQLAGHTPTDGKIIIFNNVPLWDVLPMIETIAVWIAAVVIFSIILIPSLRSRFRRTPPV